MKLRPGQGIPNLNICHYSVEVRQHRSVIATIALVCLSALVVVGVPDTAVAATCSPYPDVSASNPHCENIEWLKGKNITKPADGNYHPLGSVTRGSMAAFLFRLVNPGEAQPTCDMRPFPDVSTSNSFCGYIDWAKTNGIAFGYPNGDYGPSNAVTRGAMAAYLYRVAETGHAVAKCAERPFSDVATGSTFCGVISWLVAKKITYGVGGGKYGVAVNVTRQSMASFLHRTFNVIGGQTFSDGMHRVGTELQPGTYRSKVPEGSFCYWERLSDASGSLDSIIANGTPGGYALIEVLPTDKYINSSDCGIWHSVSSSTPWSFHGKIPGDGTFLVGTDIKPGTYHETAADCYWERDSSALGDGSDIIANGFTSGAAYVTIKASDKVFVASGCSTFTPTD